MKTFPCYYKVLAEYYFNGAIMMFNKLPVDQCQPQCAIHPDQQLVVVTVTVSVTQW